MKFSILDTWNNLPSVSTPQYVKDSWNGAPKAIKNGWDHLPAASSVPVPKVITENKKAIAAGAVCGTIAVTSAPLVLGATGFTSSGVAAGSLASMWHSMIGIVSPGSMFSVLQSAGAAGFGLATKLFLGASGAAAGAAASKKL